MDSDLTLDPVVTSIHYCIKDGCGSRMGQLRVYQGSGKRELRGAVCQTCTNKQCNWTKIFTDPYRLEDAEELVRRLKDPTLGNRGRLRPPPTSPPPSTQNRRNPCANTSCFTNKGTRTLGNQSCIEDKCLSCCRDAHSRAVHDGTARLKCPIHNMSQVVPTARPEPFPLATQSLDIFDHDSQTPPSTQRAPAQPTPEPAPQPTQTQRPRTTRTQPLAQPLPPSWNLAYTQAHEKTDRVKNMKDHEQEMEEIRRRTVTFVIYHTAMEEPLEVEEYIELTPRSIFDVYSGGKWRTVKMKNVLDANTENRVLVRLRPNILKPMKDNECLGLDDELVRQLSARPANPKKAAHTLVSPAKKAPNTQSAPPPPPTPPPSHPVIPIEDKEEPVPKIPTQAAVILPKPSIADSRLQPAPRFEAKPVWPGNFYTVDVQDGLRQIEVLCAAGSMQSSAFCEVFAKVGYSKSTFCKQKAEWHESPAARRKQFADYGRTTAGLFSNYRLARRGKAIKLSPPPENAAAKPSRGRKRSRSRSISVALSDDHDFGSPSPPARKRTQHRQTRSPSFVPSEPIEMPSPTNISDDMAEVDELDSDSGDDLGTNLCPFCDDPLPPSLSKSLESELHQLMSVSTLDPQPNNPRHRRTSSFKIHIEFCKRHDFETRSKPQGDANGWPTSPDFSRLSARITRLKPILDVLLRDPKMIQNSTFFQESKSAYAPGPSRSLRGMGFTSFINQGAGYYGERGFALAMDVLQKMYPEMSVDLTMLSPLAWRAIIEEYLLPEAISRLIADDLGLRHSEAIETLKASRTYGNTLHPIETEDSTIDGVAVKLEPADTQLPSIATLANEVIEIMD
ncbi:hypothetical protein D9611_012560 [Ephemerocybe angulata]|uniref:Restriction of telomere capping protein 4 n=1 Tax=Ephemerocybe angulata TaxID=980116 RepID=A0A8H5AUU6_9AGAR|nr:hypothetical protein D9611_012560 [Tulosesus angulatus]